MAINFPNNPNPNDTWSEVGKTWLWDGTTWKLNSTTSSGITDGDKGDITVSNSGGTWNIDANTIGTTELSASGTTDLTTYLRGDNTWQPISGLSGLQNVVEDITPQLGGKLDCQIHNIDFYSGGACFGGDSASYGARMFIHHTNGSGGTSFIDDSSANGLYLMYGTSSNGKVVVRNRTGSTQLTINDSGVQPVKILDKDGQVGGSGQILSSTGTGIDWIDVISKVGTITVTDESQDTECYPLFSKDPTGDIAPKTGTNIKFNSASGQLEAGSFKKTGGTSSEFLKADGSIDTTTYLSSVALNDLSNVDAVTNVAQGKILKYNGSDWEVADDNASGGGGGATTINNNADNRIITGSASANTLNAESSLTYDGNSLFFSDDKAIKFGSNLRMQMYTDGSINYIKSATDGSGAFPISIHSGSSEVINIDDGNTQIKTGLKDKDGDLGSAGQVLSSTGTQVNWVNASTGGSDTNTTYSISCADGDNADEEKIRLTAGGSGSGDDDIVLEAGTGLTIARDGDKITFTNSVSNSDTKYDLTGVATSNGVKIRLAGLTASGNTNDDVEFTPAGGISYQVTGNTVEISSINSLSGLSDVDYQSGSPANNKILKFNTSVNGGKWVLADDVSGGSGLTIANNANNRIVTGMGGSGLHAEGNLTFDGSTLSVTGTATISGALTAGGLTYPTTDGTNGYQLTSDGNGNVTWQPSGTTDLTGYVKKTEAASLTLARTGASNYIIVNTESYFDLNTSAQCTLDIGAQFAVDAVGQIQLHSDSYAETKSTLFNFKNVAGNSTYAQINSTGLNLYTGGIVDKNGDTGTAGQVLSTTSGGLDWVDATGSAYDLTGVATSTGFKIRLAGLTASGNTNDDIELTPAGGISYTVTGNTCQISSINSISGLSDVDLQGNSPANNQILKFNTSVNGGKWVLASDDSGGGADGNNYPSSFGWNSGNGVLTLNRSGLSAITIDLDGRYATGTIPTNNNQLTNGANYITASGTVTNSEKARIRTDTGSVNHNLVFVDSYTDNQLQILKVDNADNSLCYNPSANKLIAQNTQSYWMSEWSAPSGAAANGYSGQFLISKGSSPWEWSPYMYQSSSGELWLKSTSGTHEGGHLQFEDMGGNTSYAVDVYRNGYGSDEVLRFIDQSTGTERFSVGPQGQWGIGHVGARDYGSLGQVMISRGSSLSPQWGNASGIAASVVGPDIDNIYAQLNAIGNDSSIITVAQIKAALAALTRN
tara:strand:- start:1817 stop:5494 length:3678 start_codon:yes stop_codon:yes gene_type:complete